MNRFKAKNRPASEKSNNSAYEKRIGLREKQQFSHEKRTALRPRAARRRQAKDRSQKSDSSAEEKRTGLRARTDPSQQTKGPVSKKSNGSASKKKQQF